MGNQNNAVCYAWKTPYIYEVCYTQNISPRAHLELKVKAGKLDKKGKWFADLLILKQRAELVHSRGEKGEAVVGHLDVSKAALLRSIGERGRCRPLGEPNFYGFLSLTIGYIRVRRHVCVR